jgi:ABC-type multidrug transport system ATPase subunit
MPAHSNLERAQSHLFRAPRHAVTVSIARYNARRMDMVVADNLVKVFPAPDGGEKRAVDGLSFRVGEGQIYGLLGPNGAGKTTTLRMLSGLMAPTSGSAFLAGHDVSKEPNEVKRVMGFLTANTGLYQRLTARELIIYFAQMHGLDQDRAAERANHLIEWLNLGDFVKLRCGALSTGQKQRVNIARALVADPPILIMDEPTLGLDVLSNRIILEYIKRERDQGKTIILSTHYLDEAETMCDQIGLLHDGRLIAEGDLESLRARAGEQRLSDIFLKLIHADEAVGAIVP